jgi:cell division protein FtsB
MCAKGFLKRFLPFFLTFAAGLFIASFFVPIFTPGTVQRERRANRFHAYQQLSIDNQNLRDENQRLREQIEMLHQTDMGTVDLDEVTPVPPPPPIRMAPRHVR